MVASRKTIDEVLNVLQKHLEQEQIEDLLHDLCKVEGNKSFIKTIKGLLDLIKKV